MSLLLLLQSAFHITGVTKTGAGATLAASTVRLYRTSDNAILSSSVSDGSGNYSLSAPSGSGPYYVVAYKAGSPDVAGTTVNTLIGS